MSSSAPSLSEVHLLKCELAADALRSSGTLRLQVTGWSMLPSVWPGDTLIVDRASCDAVSEGDIVLFARESRLFAHRIVKKDRQFGDSRIITRGDAMPAPDSPVSESELLGRVSRIQRKGRWIEPRRSLRFTERAVAALVRSSEIAARVVVGIRDVRQASLG